MNRWTTKTTRGEEDLQEQRIELTQWRVYQDSISFPNNSSKYRYKDLTLNKSINFNAALAANKHASNERSSKAKSALNRIFKF